MEEREGLIILPMDLKHNHHQGRGPNYYDNDDDDDDDSDEGADHFDDDYDN